MAAALPGCRAGRHTGFHELTSQTPAPTLVRRLTWPGKSPKRPTCVTASRSRCTSRPADTDRRRRLWSPASESPPRAGFLVFGPRRKAPSPAPGLARATGAAAGGCGLGRRPGSETIRASASAAVEAKAVRCLPSARVRRARSALQRRGRREVDRHARRPVQVVRDGLVAHGHDGIDRVLRGPAGGEEGACTRAGSAWPRSSATSCTSRASASRRGSKPARPPRISRIWASL